MKRPDGWVVEEFVCATTHLYEGGTYRWSDGDTESGDYTGVYWFEYMDGRLSRRYTDKTAPKWLRALRDEAHSLVDVPNRYGSGRPMGMTMEEFDEKHRRLTGAQD